MATHDHETITKKHRASDPQQPAETKTGQEIALLVRHADDSQPMDEQLATVAGKQFVLVGDSRNPAGDVGYVPLRTVRPESVQNGKEKPPGPRYKVRANKTREKKTTTGFTKTYKRKRGRPAGSKSARSKIEQKPVLLDSSSGSSSYDKGVEDDADFEPPTPMRKRARPARSKYAKRKIEHETLLVDSISSSSEGKKDKDGDFQPEVSDDDGQNKYACVKDTAWDRAVELEEKLPAEDPSFIKCMTHSQVVQGFWLGLPAWFCRKHLPKHDVHIVLEDEEGQICDTNYLAYKMGLSGRWKGFAERHDLKIGDVLVFQLVRPTTLKVYILRENKFTATDGALGLLSLDTSKESNTSKKEEKNTYEDTRSKEQEMEVVTNSKASGWSPPLPPLPPSRPMSPHIDRSFQGAHPAAMATDKPIRRKREMPASDPRQPAETKMGQNMALVHHIDDSQPMDKEHATVAGKQFVLVDECDNQDGDVGYGPLRTVRPESAQNGKQKPPGSRYKVRANKTREKKTTAGFTKTYKRRRGRPAGSKSARSKIEQKPVLLDSSSYNKGVEDDADFEPPTPMRKRGRPARSQYAKRMIQHGPLLVDSSSSSSEGKNDNDDAFQPEVSDDDGLKKYARVKSTALDGAGELEKKLLAEGPSFTKSMTHSQVVQGFWLGLPTWFCGKYLPNHDVNIVLEDEEGEICDTNYLAYKTGLSGGWKGFAQQHDLEIGNVLVFNLVQPTRFKVYILRENKLTTTDGVLGLLSLDTSMENSTSKKDEEESSDQDIKSKEEEPEVVTGDSSNASRDNNGNLSSKEAAGGAIRSPGPGTGDFVAVKRLVNFKIVISDGSVIGRRELPDHLRKTYYELCHARKASLHRHLQKEISPALATEVIVDTAKIAKGIRASSPASIEDLVAWKKKLELFETMGMDVTFLRKRVDDLLGLLSAPPSTSVEPEGYKYEELKLRRTGVVKQLRYLESSVSILHDTLKEIDVEMEATLEASTKKQKDQAVRNLAAAPW